MNNYSIADLQQLSGIKAHTIRIWEQRYNALKPKRSEGNTRFYDDSQLRRLLNIVSLSETGIKISELCSLSDKKLGELIEEKLIQTTKVESTQEFFISQMILAGMNFEESIFEKHFSSCILKFGISNTYSDIIYPLLKRVGLMWGKDSITPAQEHFMSCLIRQKLITAIDALPPVSNSKQKWVLFLPSFESHEIGLLFAHYLLKSNGIKVIYLGANVPLESLKSAVKEINPSHLFFFIVHTVLVEAAQDYIQTLKEIAGKSNVLVSGNSKIIGAISLPKNTFHIETIEKFEKIIHSHV